MKEHEDKVRSETARSETARSECKQFIGMKASGGGASDVPNALWDSPNWVGERKIDGTRITLLFYEDEIRITTRRISKKTDRLMERTDNFPHIRDSAFKSLYGTILDGEIISPTFSFNDTMSMVGSSPEKAIEVQEKLGLANFYAFDCPYFCGVDKRNHTLYERRGYLSTVIDHFHLNDIKWIVKVQQHEDKRALYKRELSAGREGIMLKYLDGKYGDRKTWIKAKKQITLDMVICGIKEGKGRNTGRVGALEVGFYTGAGQDIESVSFASGLTDVLRDSIVRDPKKYLGKVIEVKAQEFTVTGSLRHPRFIRFRPDKPIEECRRSQIVRIE